MGEHECEIISQTNLLVPNKVYTNNCQPIFNFLFFKIQLSTDQSPALLIKKKKKIDNELTHHFLLYKLVLLMIQLPSTLQASIPVKIQRSVDMKGSLYFYVESKVLEIERDIFLVANYSLVVDTLSERKIHMVSPQGQLPFIST